MISEDFCECPDLGYYLITNKPICPRCNKHKQPGYIPNPSLYAPLPDNSPMTEIEELKKEIERLQQIIDDLEEIKYPKGH